MGSLRLTGCELAEATYDLSMGSIDGSAVFKGRQRLNCSMGSIKLKLAQDPSAVAYDLQTSLGSIRVDGRGLGTSARQINPAAEAVIEVSVRMGSIDLRFE